MELKEVKPMQIGKLNLIHKILRVLPYHCSYCGSMYKKCHSDKVNLLMPLPQNGRCCPNGHEGYVDEFTGYATIRHWFDLVKKGA